MTLLITASCSIKQESRIKENTTKKMWRGEAIYPKIREDIKRWDILGKRREQPKFRPGPD